MVRRVKGGREGGKERCREGRREVGEGNVKGGKLRGLASKRGREGL